jgi:hypothetical protein
MKIKAPPPLLLKYDGNKDDDGGWPRHPTLKAYRGVEVKLHTLTTLPLKTSG